MACEKQQEHLVDHDEKHGMRSAIREARYAKREDSDGRIGVLGECIACERDG